MLWELGSSLREKQFIGRQGRERDEKRGGKDSQLSNRFLEAPKCQRLRICSYVLQHRVNECKVITLMFSK